MKVIFILHLYFVSSVFSLKPDDYGFKLVEDSIYRMEYMRPDNIQQSLEVTIEDGEAVFVFPTPPNSELWDKTNKKLAIVVGPEKERKEIPLTGWETPSSTGSEPKQAEGGSGEGSCSGPYTKNVDKKPTPLDFGFKHLGAGIFEKLFYNHDYLEETIRFTVTPDGVADFKETPDFQGNPHKPWIDNGEVTVWDSKNQDRKKISLPVKGWYVPPECAVKSEDAKGNSPEQYGFVHEGKGVYIKKYKNADDLEDTIKMRIDKQMKARFTYHPERAYFPLKHQNGKVEIREGRDTKYIPVTGWEPGKEVFNIKQSSGTKSLDKYGFEDAEQGIYVKEFKGQDGKDGKIRLRFNDGVAEFNFNESPNIEELDNGVLKLKLYGDKGDIISPTGWNIPNLEETPRSPLTRSPKIDEKRFTRKQRLQKALSTKSKPKSKSKSESKSKSGLLSYVPSVLIVSAPIKQVWTSVSSSVSSLASSVSHGLQNLFSFKWFGRRSS